MTTRARCTILVWALIVASVSACSTATAVTTPDTQAAVDAAVAATKTAQSAMQATIDAAVRATTTAAPVSVEEYAVKSEEELAAMVELAVDEAAAASTECSDAATEAMADGAVTQEEVDTVLAYAAEAEAAIAYAEELIDAYYGLYGELAAETVLLLQATEEDLAVMAESTAAVLAVLQEIEATLAQGLTLAEGTAAELEAAAQAARAQAVQARAQAQSWVAAAQAERETRVQQALAAQPEHIPADRREAIVSAFEYVDAVRSALADNTVSPAELESIARLGANASAGLNSQGGPRLQQLSVSINDITAQLARGQAPQARASLGSLESALGERPSLP